MSGPNPAPALSPESPPHTAPAPEETKPTVVMSEVDSYVHERMKNQPTTLDAVLSEDVSVTEHASRLQLPKEFESYSYDCSHGGACAIHQRDPKNGDIGVRGDFVFRWVQKTKRSIDTATGVRGWLFVNRQAFPSVPRFRFSVNGGVEVGDCILMFMSAKKALAIRKAAGVRSNEMLGSRMTNAGQDKSGVPRVIMTGEPDDPRYYMPKVPAEVGKEGSDEVAPNVSQESRDF